MAVFPLLADPAGYRACDTDLLLDHAARSYWLDLFASHFQMQLDAAALVGASPDQCRAAHVRWIDEIERIRNQPSRHSRLDILLLDELRQSVLDNEGIHDEFRLIKQRENQAAIAMLPSWLERIDSSGPDDRQQTIVRGMLAGNLFDMGVKETASRFAQGGVRFDEALARVPARPWLVDHLDAMNQLVAGAPRTLKKAVVFADNAGADIVLGVLPMVRSLLQLGCAVVLTANERPSLNDVTHGELQELFGHVSAIDANFRSPSLRLVSSGNAAPLIDLVKVSPELATAANGADLIVLVGMGRGIESNWAARFTCHCWRIAMIKDPQVARTVGGRMYDAVVRADSPRAGNDGCEA